MRALVYDPSHAQRLVFADVLDPLPTSSQALVPVHSVSLNFGEVAYLVALLSRRQLEPNIGWRGSWEPVDAAARALLDRRVTGKAVLDVRGGEAR